MPPIEAGGAVAYCPLMTAYSEVEGDWQQGEGETGQVAEQEVGDWPGVG